MTRIVCIAFLALAALGCSKDSGDGQASGAKSADPAEGKGGKAKATTYTVESLLAGASGPALLGPFKGGKLGMTKDELKAASPAYAEHGDYLGAQDAGLSMGVYFEGKPERLTSMSVGVPDAEVDKIKAAWGEPVAFTDRKKSVLGWHDPATRTRALLKEGTDGDKTLWISAYPPVDDILGAPGPALGLEKGKPFLGSTPGDLESAYPEAFDRALDSLMFMKWPGDELGQTFKMQLGLKDGKTNRIQFWLHHGGNDKVKAELRSKLEAKFGQPKEVKTYSGTETQLGDGQRIVTKEQEATWFVEIDAPKE